MCTQDTHARHACIHQTRMQREPLCLCHFKLMHTRQSNTQDKSYSTHTCAFQRTLLYHSCAYDIICAYSIKCRVYHVPDYIQDLSCVYDCRVCMSFVPQATFIAARLRVCVCLLSYTHTLKAIVYTRQSYSRHFHSTAPEGVCVSAVLHAHTQGNHIHTTNDIVLKAII